jgi:deoxyribodipyrimidine photo-lyase
MAQISQTGYMHNRLRMVAASFLVPWLATAAELSAAGVTLGKNYPLPIVQHNEARTQTLQRYAAVQKTDA